MRRPLGALVALGAVWLAVACLDVTSPVTGIFAITSVILPTPSVVVRDASRDTLGDTAQLRVFAFDSKGDTVKDITVKFFAVDSTHGLRVDSLSGIAYGDSLSPAANVIARVTPNKGKGVIQTLQVPYPVVAIPDSAARSNDTTFTYDPLTTDSTGSGLLSPPMNVTVIGGTRDTLIQSYLVSYQIVQAPPSVPSPNGKPNPTVVIFDASGNDSTVAVTNTSGVAARQLRIRPSAIASGHASDTVLVVVKVQYQGKPLPVTPNDTFHLKLQVGSS